MVQHICVTLVPLFNHLSEDEQIKINRLAQHKQFKKNEIVFRPGDENLDIVAFGSMKVFQLSTNGDEQLLRVVEPGGYEGENQLFGIKNESLFGKTLETTEICRLSKQDFDQIMLRNPQIALKLFELSAQKMIQVEKQAHILSMERVEQRLANYLLDLSKVANDYRFSLPMKMIDIARYIGTTPETLSRKFRFLEDNKLIKRSGRRIIIIDEDGLIDL
ncbi:crp fnr family transcriptional regulator [Ligilactobacillus hayakitensis DSM 18933 = JCM 14209]|uniref:Crp fnr family transcriptional regulator n=1 Tax=Ligilactobacillus hayakitensis DSM 18933 = JCM 14209 TaxID=1423755 RepID=A0A0R1WXN1_9LACO|nr:Crp/Fnr family transcriptional regulator [Ligilactobacillus hayakitensis]KRM19619.1 crp fnr family transcriptional regulator [Ligilactobacillus hayakitensis DSM 18933 = JCM 14209]